MPSANTAAAIRSGSRFIGVHVLCGRGCFNISSHSGPRLDAPSRDFVAATPRTTIEERSQGDGMYDAIITGGTIIDGTGATRRRADVGITGGRIAAIGDLGDARAARTIDASGRIVAPGFIDVHTHVDAQVFWDTT
ncbi:MAG: amidohydrolase family protein, partial [Acidimicrobiales bacterium]|nr:amidohydrolase family protein [Acidimicrobiales bacterium]